MRPAPTAALLCAALACAPPDGSAPELESLGVPVFTVRGRLEEPLSITYRVDATNAPLAASSFRAAVRRAVDAWGATGVVRFVESDERPDVTFAFRRGDHGECPSFGVGAIAHAGPVSSGTFVHFDVERAWDQDDGPSLFATALHECGHVIGLGHSPDPASVMYPEDHAQRTRLTRSDLAGVHSLYGGGTPSSDDLTLRSKDGDAVLVLRGVAPKDLTDFGLLDTDGDGRDELLVWRSDPAGDGALVVYSFGAGPVLSGTRGPLYSVVAPGARVVLGVDSHRRPLLACVLGDGRVRAVNVAPGSPLAPVTGRFHVGELHDADGDGRVDEPLPADSRRTRDAGDVDGDGTPERVSR